MKINTAALSFQSQLENNHLVSENTGSQMRFLKYSKHMYILNTTFTMFIVIFILFSAKYNTIL